MKTTKKVFTYWDINSDELMVCLFGRLSGDSYIMLGYQDVDIEYDEALIEDRKASAKVAKLEILRAQLAEMEAE